MTGRTKYQEKAIQRYYDNREGIAIQRVQELVTDLYLAEGKKKEQLWKNLVTHLESLKVPQKQIDHLMKEKNLEIIAGFVNKLLEKQ